LCINEIENIAEDKNSGIVSHLSDDTEDNFLICTSQTKYIKQTDKEVELITFFNDRNITLI
jgi:hypothetical protein